MGGVPHCPSFAGSLGAQMEAEVTRHVSAKGARFAFSDPRRILIERIRGGNQNARFFSEKFQRRNHFRISVNYGRRRLGEENGMEMQFLAFFADAPISPGGGRGTQQTRFSVSKCTRKNIYAQVLIRFLYLRARPLQGLKPARRTIPVLCGRGRGFASMRRGGDQGPFWRFAGPYHYTLCALARVPPHVRPTMG